MQYGRDITIKVVGYHPHNPTQQKLPTILSTVLTFDTQNGHLLSLVEGNLVTAIRTGAASAPLGGDPDGAPPQREDPVAPPRTDGTKGFSDEDIERLENFRGRLRRDS